MISNLDQRIFFYDSDLDRMREYTIELNDYDRTPNIDLVWDTNDYLYIATFLPINHKYFEITNPNSLITANVTPEIWDGRQWRAPIEIFDYTKANNFSMNQSGVIQYACDTSKYQWSFVNRTLENQYFTEFDDLPDIYEKYWSRISFDSNLVAAELKYIGDLFCTEEDLFVQYPALNQSVLLNSWETGKTDWKRQRIAASEYVVKDLKRRNIIVERSQVIELSTLVQPAIHYTAHIIYSGLGPRNYAEEITATLEAYKDAMHQVRFEQDVNATSRKERDEMLVTTHRATR